MVDASGTISAIETMLTLLKPHGTAVIAGNPHKSASIKLDPFDFIYGKKLIGSWGGNTEPDLDFPKILALYKSGVLPIQNLISRRFTLRDINKAMRLLEKHESRGRMLIDFKSI